MPRKREGRRAEREGEVRASAVFRPGDVGIDEARLGGKGASLARLTAAGLAVPPWFVVTTDVFVAALLAHREPIGAALSSCTLDDAQSLSRAAVAIGEVVRGAALAARDATSLTDALDAFGDDAFLAVRSSAVGEDGTATSFAGQLETFLYTRPRDVRARVRDAWASAFGERVLAYRLATGARRIAVDDVRVAVVVQEMVASDASGVLFTRNPQSGAAEHVVNAAFGLGEGVVADRVVSDSYYVDRATGAVRRSIAEKDARVVFDRGRGSGTVVDPLPAEMRRRAVLDDESLRELARLGERAEAVVGGPADVEWAIANGRVFVLQARPITAVGTDSSRGTSGQARRPEPEVFFDNSNIVESFPGVTTPLTFSFARRLYAQVFRRTFEGVVVPGARPEDVSRLWPNMLGYIDGRIYYNLSTWYQMNALLPHFEKSRVAWERMLGLTEGLPLPKRADESWRDRAMRPIETVAFYATLAWRLARLRADVEKSLAHFRSVHAAAVAVDYDALSASELSERFRAFERDALKFAHQTNVNDFFVSRAYDALSKVIARFGLDPEGAHLENDLLCGEKGMESVEPVRSVLRLVAMARADAAVRTHFQSDASAEAVLDAIQKDDALARFRKAFDAHMAAYGDRGIEELKLEVPSLRDNPAFLIAMIRNYLESDISVESLETRERAIRDAADAKVRARIGRDVARRAVFEFVVGRTRMSVRFRENLRLARSRVYGVVKRMMRAFGRAYEDSGVIDRTDDVFFLTIDEVLDAASGTSVTRDLRALVALRRAEHARFLAGPSPPARVRRNATTETQSRGSAETQRGRAGQERSAVAGAVMRGTGCSQGIATGRARVVLEPRTDLKVKGEVLVARMTDPGWVFLMISAAGIVVEKGSLLSHTAIIGRELGVPTVVGLEGATSRIRDGVRVRVDGRTGTVELLDAEGER